MCARRLGGLRKRAGPQLFVSLPIGRGGASAAAGRRGLVDPGGEAWRWRLPGAPIGWRAEGGGAVPCNNTGALLAARSLPAMFS